MQEPTLEEIIQARNRCAQIIALHGKKYLPIFKRLEHEIAEYKAQQDLFERALQINSENVTQNVRQNVAQLKKEFRRKS